MMIRLVLVDDHPVVHAGLRALLDSQTDLSVVAEADDGPSAQDAVRRFRPDVVLMDLNLGGGPGGVAITAHLCEQEQPPRVLILTTYDTDADVLAAVDAGATGYLLKDAPPAQLFDAIRGIARGTMVFAPAVAARLVRRTTAAAPMLTAREIEILQLLAQGLSNRTLARRLFVSEATVKSHLGHIYTKLGVDSRTAAVAVAAEQRIIRLEQAPPQN